MVAGIVGAAAVRGWRGAAAFALGAALAVGNYHLWKRATAAIGVAGRRPRTASAIFLGVRYLILGAILFAIIKFFEVSAVALLAGLLVPAAAVLVEIIYELFN
ncbi:MAG TPA: hypothetical protein VFA28_14160 [Bryobacteraceae bacterium]|jgi:hypothetical protein|nr:hypothetical protein [Bryobacteraceae bacterium]